jgi:multidrug efflux pump subunit AcrA (membrane-fusion protein)
MRHSKTAIFTTGATLALMISAVVTPVFAETTPTSSPNPNYQVIEKLRMLKLEHKTEVKTNLQDRKAELEKARADKKAELEALREKRKSELEALREKRKAELLALRLKANSKVLTANVKRVISNMTYAKKYIDIRIENQTKKGLDVSAAQAATNDLSTQISNLNALLAQIPAEPTEEGALKTYRTQLDTIQKAARTDVETANKALNDSLKAKKTTTATQHTENQQ